VFEKVLFMFFKLFQILSEEERRKKRIIFDWRKISIHEGITGNY
jgi:hypothetical protein